MYVSDDRTPMAPYIQREYRAFVIPSCFALEMTMLQLFLYAKSCKVVVISYKNGSHYATVFWPRRS